MLRKPQKYFVAYLTQKKGWRGTLSPTKSLRYMMRPRGNFCCKFHGRARVRREWEKLSRLGGRSANIIPPSTLAIAGGVLFVFELHIALGTGMYDAGRSQQPTGSREGEGGGGGHISATME